MKIKIGYNKVIVSLPVVLSLLLLALTLYSDSQGLKPSRESWFLIFGLLVFSVPMYFLPYIVVTENEIWVNNQFGMPRRRAKISGLKDLRFEHGAIMVKSDDFERKLYYSKMLVDINALKKFRDLVNNQ